MARAGDLVDALAARAGITVPPLRRGKPGDPGLFGPDSVVWTVARERVLLAGGQAALLLQLAHPLVAAGVADHSGFRDDPMARLRATLQAVLTISFGDRDQCEEAAESVRAVHRRVQGSLSQRVGRYPAGTPYDAADPHLAMWVHATLVVTALDAFDRFVRPLTRVEREEYYRQTIPFAALFGVGAAVLPATYPEFLRYLDAMLSGQDLEVGEQAEDAAMRVLAPPLPAPMRPVAKAARLATAGLLPERFRTAYGLRWSTADRTGFDALASGFRAGLKLTPRPVRFWPHYLQAVRRASEAVPSATPGND